MLPRGMVSERPWACFHIRIYDAEGLPSMDSGLMAKMAVGSDRTVFIDPYVRVTFAGQQVETGERGSCRNPAPPPDRDQNGTRSGAGPFRFHHCQKPLM